MGALLSTVMRIWSSQSPPSVPQLRAEDVFTRIGEYTLGSPVTAIVEITGPWEGTVAGTNHRYKTNESIFAIVTLPTGAKVCRDWNRVVVDCAILLEPARVSVTDTRRPDHSAADIKVGEMIRRNTEYPALEPCITVRKVIATTPTVKTIPTESVSLAPTTAPAVGSPASGAVAVPAVGSPVSSAVAVPAVGSLVQTVVTAPGVDSLVVQTAVPVDATTISIRVSL